MRLRCPVCHAECAPEAWMQEEAARELFGLLAQQPAGLARALTMYLGLWRPAKRALAWDRAVRIARETLALAQPEVLEQALTETVEALRAKRDAGDARALDSHGYLKKVIESVAARGAVRRAEPARAARSRTAQAVAGFLGMSE